MTPQIQVQNLSKTYRVPERGAGLAASLKGLVRRTYRDVEAVRDISFAVEAGEMVGFIGPNGAGKTTTLKMLSGLLYPTAGETRVLGFTPWERRAGYLRQISMVLGNKSQMLWDIPPLDPFQVLAEIYHVPPADYRQTVGERMKCELVAGLLHRPHVLFLDEPTLGLDVSMQGRLRRSSMICSDRGLPRAWIGVRSWTTDDEEGLLIVSIRPASTKRFLNKSSRDSCLSSGTQTSTRSLSSSCTSFVGAPLPGSLFSVSAIRGSVGFDVTDWQE